MKPGLVISALLGLVTWLSPIAGQGQPAAGNATVGAMSEYFDEIVFGSEFKDLASPPGVISKWSGEVAISIQGRLTPQLAATTSRHLNRLAALTGLKFKQVKPGNPAPGISMVFGNRAEMTAFKGEGIPPELVQKLARSGGCYFIAFHRPPEKIIKAIIMVNVERTDDAITSCLLEELTQSLGLPNDSNLLRPSIFSDSDRLLELSRHDEILLRTLYDSRMPAGTSRAEARKLAPAIIEDWNSRLPQ